MLPDISHDTAGDLRASGAGDALARQQAVKQIERKRHFWISAALGTLAMLVLTLIWALSEYHNAGGWPADGFSQSSGIPNVWNYWIIYPAIAWVFLTAAGGLSVYLRKPISERDIQREIEHERGR
jgi:2TM domain